MTAFGHANGGVPGWMLAVSRAESGATGDIYQVNHDHTLTVSAADGVLNQFIPTDPSATYTVSLAGGPSSGSLTLNSDGSFTYTPSAHFVGADTFTVNLLSNGTPTGTTGSVEIDVVNTAPVANDHAYTVTHDHTLSGATVLDDAYDAEGDTLTSSVVSNPTNGTLTFNSDGTFSYTPTHLFVGTDSFTYKVNDGLLDSALATVTIAVTDTAPVANADAYSVLHDRSLNIRYSGQGVLGNDTDAEGDPLTAVLVSSPSNGSLTLNADGTFTYTPNLGFVGTDTFTYAASDGILQSPPATVAITVYDHVPVPSGGALFTTQNQSAMIMYTPGSDVDNDPLTVAIVSGPSHGQLSNQGGTLTYTPAAGFVGTDSFTYTLSDGALTSDPASYAITVGASPYSQPPIVARGAAYTVTHDHQLAVAAPGLLSGVSGNGGPFTAALVSGTSHGTLTLNSDGSFVYTPNAGFVGGDTFTFQASGSGNTSNVAMVAINVLDSAPVALGEAYAVTENSTLTVSAPGLLGNATDADGDALSAQLVSPPASGALSLNSDGSFNYTPATDFTGVTSFTYQAFDGIKPSLVALAIIQVEPAPKVTGLATIYNGLAPTWGGQQVKAEDKTTKGAVTAANLNDTDGNGTADVNDTSVTVAGITNPPGRDEQDLMQLVLAQPQAGGAAAKGTARITVSGGSAKLWQKSTKGAVYGNGTQATFRTPTSGPAASPCGWRPPRRRRCSETSSSPTTSSLPARIPGRRWTR